MDDEIITVAKIRHTLSCCHCHVVVMSQSDIYNFRAQRHDPTHAPPVRHYDGHIVSSSAAARRVLSPGGHLPVQGKYGRPVHLLTNRQMDRWIRWMDE